jgi:hypothetical protein
VKNDALESAELDAAAKQAGFTPPVRVLLQNPVVLDMMSSEFGWTQELGQAFVNDQDGVLEAVQRLRLQAKLAGNLSTSDKMVVGTELQDGQQAIVLSSPQPDVVYVPQYDPETVYSPVAEDSSGHSTGTVVATALLAFGAGVLVGNLFHHDDDDWYDDDYYTPHYYGRPMAYYPPYPYRPVYGGGYYASTAYVRPPAYRYAYTNTTIVQRDVNNYWGRYDDRTYSRGVARPVVSPITRARPNRPELGRLNELAKRGPKWRGPDKAQRDAFEARDRNARERAGDRGAGDARRPADADRARPGADRGDADRVRPGDRGGKGDRQGKGNGGDRVRPGGGKGNGGDRVRPGGGKGNGGDRVRPGGGKGNGGDRVRPGGGGGRERPKSRPGGGGGKAGGGKAGGGKAGGGRGGGKRSRG